VSVKEKHENRSGEDQRDERMRTDRSWMKGECHISHCESVRVKSLASLESSSLQIDMLMMMTGGHLWNACTQHYNLFFQSESEWNSMECLDVLTRNFGKDIIVPKHLKQRGVEPWTI
jgi:hypothetical protein